MTPTLSEFAAAFERVWQHPSLPSACLAALLAMGGGE